MNQGRILTQTNDFIRLYIHTTGDSEVPYQYHFWSCVSMIAALLGNRCGYRKFREKLLKPNLYVILLGPAGIGKGEAIGKCLSFIKDIPSVNLFNGKITGPRMLDKMGHKEQTDEGKYEIRDSVIYLTTEELAFGFGVGTRAEDLITTLTQLWAGSDHPFDESTRQHKDVTLRNPCVNWLAGSTLSWLLRSLTDENVRGGFFSRCVIVNANYDFNKRRRRPTYPQDYDEVMSRLRQTVEWLAQASGEFRMSAEAEELEDIWYNTRDEPDNPEEEGGDWKREHDMLLKLSMIFSISSRYDEFLITKDHITKAQQVVAGLNSVKKSIRVTSSKATSNNDLENVEKAIKKAGVHGILGAVLLRKMGKYGIKKTEFDECILTLERRDDIEVLSTSKGVLVYRWRKGRRIGS